MHLIKSAALSLLLMSLSTPGWTALSCRQIFGTDLAFETQNLARILTDKDQKSVPTVFTRNLTADHVELVKPSVFPWASRYDHTGTGFNLQGDPRNIILILGAKLSAAFGISARESAKGDWTLKIPRMHVLKEKIQHLNSRLPQDQRIHYLPVETGFASSRESFALSISGREGFLLLFPFAERAQEVTVHDISYHLGAMVLPKSILQKINQINQETQRWVSFLESHGQALGPLVSRMVDQLIATRALELDVGTGNITDFLASSRLHFPGKSYEEILWHIDGQKLLKPMQLLARPAVPARETVVEHMIRQFGLEASVKDILGRSSGEEFFTLYKSRVTKIDNMNLSAEQKTEVIRLIKKFVAETPNPPSMDSWQFPAQAVRELFQGLDQRLESWFEVLSTDGRL